MTIVITLIITYCSIDLASGFQGKPATLDLASGFQGRLQIVCEGTMFIIIIIIIIIISTIIIIIIIIIISISSLLFIIETSVVNLCLRRNHVCADCLGYKVW